MVRERAPLPTKDPLEITPAARRLVRRVVRQPFSDWMPWTQRNSYEHVHGTGVYVLAHFKRVPAGQADPSSSRTIYIGETGNSFGTRWRQFHHSACGRSGHGGGITHYRRFKGSIGDLYVAALPFGELADRDGALVRVLYESHLLFMFLMRHRRLPSCNTVTRVRGRHAPQDDQTAATGGSDVVESALAGAEHSV